MKNKYGSTINVVEHIILRNGWEYYVTDEKFDDDTIQCVVMGYETEIGDVYMPEIKPYIVSKTKNLNELAPCQGWEWAQ
jgi:hypothetical protein